MNDRMTVSTEMLNKVLNVLAQRPYAEVAQVINELQQDIKPILTEVPEEASNG